MGLLSVSANRAVAAVVADGDTVERWWIAVRDVLRAESHDDRGLGAPLLCRTLLAVMGSQPPPDVRDLPAIVNTTLHNDDFGVVGAVYAAFRRDAMPVSSGLELFAEIGAVDRDGRITELGQWMALRLVEEWPTPVSPNLPAAALLDRLARLPDEEVWQQARRWLYGRNVLDAAGELFAVAGTASAAQRIVAVDVVGGLGESVRPVWQGALEQTMLAAHARLVLAQFEDHGADEPESDAADRRWLAVEYAMAALTVDGPHEAYLVLQEHDGLDEQGRSGHPDETALRGALAELIAAGGPPVPTYEMKVALVRVRPPVWRRVRIPASATLDELHRVIQVVFDWDDDHLHMFTADKRRYADSFFRLDECADEARARLSRVMPRVGVAMTYVYDLGDEWEHLITLERVVVTEEPEMSAVCVGGKGDAPEEDWYPGCGRDGTPFDLAEINRRLARIAPSGD
jgi:hypothetical protein